MTRSPTTPTHINSLSELHRILNLPNPEHPLISVLDVEEIDHTIGGKPRPYTYNFYMICIKKGVTGAMKYGQGYYDFDEGIVSFIAPRQILDDGAMADAGWLLLIHPDFMRGYALASKIRSYGFFSYAVDEALHLSGKEETAMETLMQNIQREYQSNVDDYSQDVMISQIELLLNYANRFYNRQFITRKPVNDDLLTKLEAVLDHYFEGENPRTNGLPTVQYISKKLNKSPNYLSDMLRQLTGQSTQQHIHDKLIEKAKEQLSTTELLVSEIAYDLGFEHSQSFSRLFKNKTDFLPSEFRQSFN